MIPAKLDLDRIEGLAGRLHDTVGWLAALDYPGVGDAMTTCQLGSEVVLAMITRIREVEGALGVAAPYAEQAVKDDGGIDNCEIGDRLALERIRTALQRKTP